MRPSGRILTEGDPCDELASHFGGNPSVAHNPPIGARGGFELWELETPLMNIPPVVVHAHKYWGGPHYLGAPVELLSQSV